MPITQGDRLHAAAVVDEHVSLVMKSIEDRLVLQHHDSSEGKKTDNIK